MDAGGAPAPEDADALEPLADAHARAPDDAGAEAVYVFAAVAAAAAPQPTGSNAPAAPAERRRARSCEAAGCTQQLTGAVHGKEYNRRYRLCQVHLRSSEVDVQGVPSRWCQTCSRFQPLSAFQGSKRTCSDQLSALRVRRRARAAERSAPSEAAGEQAAAAACEPPLSLGADSDLLDWLAVSREPSRSALPPTDVAGLFVDAMPLHAAPAGADVAAPSLALALASPQRDLSAGHDREPDEPPPDEPHARAVGRERQADA